METDKKHTVLVTGGRGFVGRAVCKLLQREGYRVIALDQAPSAEELPDAPVAGREVHCDISDAAQLPSVFEGERIDTIVHLAAILPTVAQRDPLRTTHVNVDGSLHLLEMARQFGVRRVVFGSSLSVYGTFPPQESVAETHRALPEDLYGAAKLYVERMGEAYRNRDGLEFVSLRIGRVVGPGVRSTTSAWRGQIFDYLRTAESSEISIPYAGSERTLVVYVEDVARMLAALVHAAHLSHAVYNAACESVIISELKRQVESLNPKIRVILGNGEALGNPRRLDASRFEQEFGFRPVPIFDQLKRAAGK